MFKDAKGELLKSGATVTVARVDSTSMYVDDWVLDGQRTFDDAVVVVVGAGVADGDDGEYDDDDDGAGVVVRLVLVVLSVAGLAVIVFICYYRLQMVK